MQATRKPRTKSDASSPATGAAAGKARRYRVAFTATEFDALKFVAKKFGHETDATATRFCIKQQRLREIAFGIPTSQKHPAKARNDAKAGLVAMPEAGEYGQIATAVRAGLGTAQRRGQQFADDAPLIQWSLWVYEDTVADADASKSAWDLNRIDAVRLAIRVQSLLSGFQPPGGVWS